MSPEAARYASLIRKSLIIRLLLNFNKKILLFFSNSRMHTLFTKLCTLFKGAILKNMHRSLVIKTLKRIAGDVRMKDTGAFIILVVLFNSLAMLYFKKVMDIFSIASRVVFFILGIVFILWKDTRLR